MKSIDILYTPLDIESPPDFDSEKLSFWIKKFNKKQIFVDRTERPDARDTTQIKNYPWTPIWPRYNGEWKFNFEKEFPLLSQYFSEATNFEEKLDYLILLPVKPNFQGLGFWHWDLDEYGFRVYLDNDDLVDSLLIRPTIEPYEEQQSFMVKRYGPWDFIQKDVVYSATIKHNRQPFCLNNVRSIHAVDVHKLNSSRIAAGFGTKKPKFKTITEEVEDLIVNSAKKNSESAIIWSPPKDYRKNA